MKKKISVLLCVFVLALSFAGCGNKKEAIDYNSEKLEQYAEMVVTSFSQMDENAFQQFKDGSELEINLMLMQTGLPVEKEEFVSMMDAWRAAVDECGSYVGHGEFVIEADNKKVVVSTAAEYEKREAVLEIRFDEKLNMKSMDVSAKYTTGEILKKAGLNTVLGMGTVFAVLIFLAFVISLLKYIPAMAEKFNHKGNEKVVERKTPASAPAAVVSAASDDLELAAVITAAIEAYTGKTSDEFVVRSIKRRTSNKWN